VIHIDERHYQWVYSATALAGLLLVLFLPGSTSRVAPASRGKYIVLQVLTLVGAIVGAKLAFLAGDLSWPVSPVRFDDVVFSGRSITGGLLGGFLTAEIAKVPLRYAELPNDWFAVKLPLSIAVGRVGCVFAGCCRGIGGSYAVSMVYSDGVSRFPAQLCELGFQVVAFGAAYAVFRHHALRGRIFATYMIAYGVFRVGIEALRDTHKLDLGLSVYQLLSVALAACGVASFAWYSRSPLQRGAS
jgi:phosphatidylglycerol:prolipoprotein diacylglycerol transferase